MMQRKYGWGLSLGSGKVILTLLAEVIIFNIEFTTIDLKWSGLQWLFTGVVKGENSGFKDRSEDLLQIFFYILSNKRLNSRGVSWDLVMARLWRGWRPQWNFGSVFPARASTTSDGSYPSSKVGAERDESLSMLFKWAGWPVGYGAIRIVKGWSIYIRSRTKPLGCLA